MTRVDTGTVLAGKYRLDALIGRGGMGSVWRAEHLGLNAPVAVKLLDAANEAFTDELLQRFYREARAAANIRSPHVVQILDHGVDNTLGAPFIVMELMDGESLAQRLARVRRLSSAEAAHIFTHVARALARAHEAGIVHRDLKPDNVFLVRNEDEVVAKVLDFGIAKAQAHGIDPDLGTRTGTVMGTAYYMSPEQISGEKSVDFRTDLWAFGVMACECLTGARPFEADSIGGLTLKICIAPVPAPSSLGSVPSGFDAWFFQITHREPAKRFASAREAAEALRLTLLGEGGTISVTGPGSAPADHDVERRPQITSFTTGKPLSVSSSESVGRPPRAPRRRVLWLLAGILFAGLFGGLWLKNAATNDGHPFATGRPEPSSAVQLNAPSSRAPAAAVLPAVSAVMAEPPSVTPRASTAAPVPSAAPSEAIRALKARAAGTRKYPITPAVVSPPPRPRDVIDDRR